VAQRVIAAYRADIQSLTESNAKVVDALVTSIRRRQIIGSLNVALATGALIQNIVRTVRYNTVDELITVIKAIGRRLMDANPRGMSSLFRTGELG
jgi:translation initiation factor eIF-2B subunit beta